MPELIHESEGLKIVRNDRNKFCVCTLFYYADPEKRKPEWENTVRQGMSQRDWAKEYLIDYTAKFGDRVFPELQDKRDSIVVPATDFDSGQFWGGFDYGARNPSSFHVYTYCDGAFYAIWELYKPCKNIPEFALEIKQCPYYHRLKYIAADPSLFAKRTHSAGGEPESVANLFIKEGISKFIPGNTDEETLIATIRKHWEKEDPSFKISESCRNLIREFENATFEDYSSDKVKEMSNFKEGIVDKDNHAMDDNKYFFNSQPSPKSGIRSKFANDIASKWYSWGGKTRKGKHMAEYQQPGFIGMKHPRSNELTPDYAPGIKYGWKQQGR